MNFKTKTFEKIVLIEEGIIEEMSDLFREWAWVDLNFESCYTFSVIYLGEQGEEHAPEDLHGDDDDDEGKFIGVNCTF